MFRNHKLDWFLVALTVACAAAMVVTSEDRLPASLKGTAAGSLLLQLPTGNQIVFNLSVGLIASVLMFFLVVRVPEHTKRLRVRRNLSVAYDSFKEASIAVFLSAINKSYSTELLQELKVQEKFKEYFSEPFASGQTRWDGVANGLDDYKIRTLVVEVEVFMNELHYTLAAIDVREPKAFELLKRLSHILYRSKNWSTEYDDVKGMLGFMWSLHTGWDWATGYRSTDLISETIAAV